MDVRCSEIVRESATATLTRDLAVAIAIKMHCTRDEVDALRIGGLVYDMGVIARH